MLVKIEAESWGCSVAVVFGGDQSPFWHPDGIMPLDHANRSLQAGIRERHCLRTRYGISSIGQGEEWDHDLGWLHVPGSLLWKLAPSRAPFEEEGSLVAAIRLLKLPSSLALSVLFDWPCAISQRKEWVYLYTLYSITLYFVFLLVRLLLRLQGPQDRWAVDLLLAVKGLLGAGVFGSLIARCANMDDCMRLSSTNCPLASWRLNYRKDIVDL